MSCGAILTHGDTLADLEAFRLWEDYSRHELWAAFLYRGVVAAMGGAQWREGGCGVAVIAPGPGRAGRVSVSGYWLHFPEPSILASE